MPTFNVGDRVVRINLINTADIYVGAIGTVARLYAGYVFVKWDHLTHDRDFGSDLENSPCNLKLYDSRVETPSINIATHEFFHVDDYFYNTVGLYWAKVISIFPRYDTTYISFEIVATTNGDFVIGETFRDNIRNLEENLTRKIWVPVTKENVIQYLKNWDLL